VSRVRRLSVRARWAVPAGTLAVVGVIIAATTVASAEAAPSLPARSAAQLLAEVQQGLARPLGPLTATVQETSSLGLPQLPAVAQANGAPNMLGGTQTINIWYLDPQHIRLAEPVQMGETDLRLDGRTLWLWDSKTQTATRVALPAKIINHAGNGAVPGQAPAIGSGIGGSSIATSPLAAARQVLAAIGPSTAVTVQRNLYVAGRAAYQLSFVPRSNSSLVGQILIAIDAQRHIPLRVQVIARGASSPAYSLGFTSLTFGPPAMSNFTFTPPPGATVKTEKVPSQLPPGLIRGGLPGLGLGGLGLGALGLPVRPGAVMGSGFAAPVKVSGGIRLRAMPRLPKQALRQIKASFIRSLPKNMPKAERAQVIKAFEKHFALIGGGFCKVSGTPNNGGGFCISRRPAAVIGSPLTGPLPPGLAASGQPTVIGKDWLSVIATRPSPAVAAAVRNLLGTQSGRQPFKITNTYSSSSSGVGSMTTETITASPAPIGPYTAFLGALLRASTRVHGSWGSGRLLRTSLLSVLITSNGRILAGAVTPAVLYADAALPVK